jgi:S1-C subfamily serine protease
VRFLALLVTFVMCGAFSGIARAQTAGTPSRTVEEQKTIDLYKRVNRSVVFITTRSYVVDPFTFFEDIKPQEGTGSGTIIDAEKRLVVTNLHVVQGALQSGGTVEIMLASGENSKATLVGYDQENDIAVLKFSDKVSEVVAVPFGDSSKLEVGQRVFAIGNPFGLYRSLTSGIVSSLDRTMKTGNGTALRDLIQTDAAINPGNSGGPLLDGDGRLIGINTAILSQSGSSAGIGFAVPINNIRRMLPELLTSGKVSRPRMGWQLVDTDQGPMVLRTAPSSVAANAGISPIERTIPGNAFVRGYREDIESADLIFKVNGNRVRTRDEVEDAIRQSDREKSLTLVLRKGGVYGREREIKVVPRWE